MATEQKYVFITMNLRGNEADDVAQAFDEVVRLIQQGNTSGQCSNTRFPHIGDHINCELTWYGYFQFLLICSASIRRSVSVSQSRISFFTRR